MYPRMLLDIDFRDLASGWGSVGCRESLEEIAERVARRWYPAGDALVCLSVRTGFDLLLSALALPRGSEVLVSAVTIRDMARILDHHGLIPVPVDLDMERLAPRLDRLEQAITPSTRAVLVAHLFGSRVPMQPIVEIARRHGLLLFEDCAQAFVGRDDTGHPGADVSMFSFGIIKTATALGGALLRVADPDLRARMQAIQACYPVQTRCFMARRLLKACFLKAISPPRIYGLAVRLVDAVSGDYDPVISAMARGFPGPDFFARIRQRPSVPLLGLLERRLNCDNPERIARRAACGERVSRALPDWIERPGKYASAHTYWVYPIVAEEPDRLIAAFRDAGFDATRGTTSLAAIAAPPNRPECEPVEARHVLARMVYLPVYPELPERELERLVALVSCATVPTRRARPCAVGYLVL